MLTAQQLCKYWTSKERRDTMNMWIRVAHTQYTNKAFPRPPLTQQWLLANFDILYAMISLHPSKTSSKTVNVKDRTTLNTALVKLVDKRYQYKT